MSDQLVDLSGWNNKMLDIFEKKLEILRDFFGMSEDEKWEMRTLSLSKQTVAVTFRLAIWLWQSTCGLLSTKENM